ncbi:type II toxin-antitoxin system Phd/YefM family antitoxin [Lacrimispora amygdalina]|uniref:type II toxin-antitoxin system Phd/YefM family antitoxin n=1 Tax=Lacrimispora amygdalina TaxID=253257 RepID=UPI000BE34DF3|nr:type II toxin-antitoxin system Phd/YefM family antitoxin [Lacrimispora amygdalina]
MFVVTSRDLQTKLKGIKERVNEGEEAILHSNGHDDLVLITLERYNELLSIEKDQSKTERRIEDGRK